jgi:hypothetical protein
MTDKSDKSGRNQTISARQERVAAYLAVGRTVAAASRECHVSTATIWEWHKQQPFRDRVAELRQELTDRAIGRLADMMAGDALDTLRKLLGVKSDMVKLDSVKAVYELLTGLKNSADLQSRIEALEAGQPKGRR